MDRNEIQYHRNFHETFPKGRQHYPDTVYTLSHSAMMTGLSCVGYFWALLSFISMGASCVGFYMPYWIEGTMRNNTPTSLGIFRRCNYLSQNDDGDVITIMECGRYTEFTDIPSIWWQIGTVTAGVGCGIQILVTFAILFSCCINDVISHTSSKVGGVLQVLSGLLIGTGCSLYPLGWSSDEVRQVCGPRADVFYLGNCSISWAYYAIIGGGGASLLCALLSCHSAKYYKGYRRAQPD